MNLRFGAPVSACACQWFGSAAELIGQPDATAEVVRMALKMLARHSNRGSRSLRPLLGHGIEHIGERKFREAKAPVPNHLALSFFSGVTIGID
jgi:hypothetical protein